MPFMDNLSKLAKTVGDGAKVAAKKSGDMVEVAKLNMAVSAEEDKIKNLYAEMGKLIYEKFKGGPDIEEGLMARCSQIDEINIGIEELKDKITKIKNSKLCNACGAEMENEVIFCPKCGAKQE